MNVTQSSVDDTTKLLISSSASTAAREKKGDEGDGGNFQTPEKNAEHRQSLQTYFDGIPGRVMSSVRIMLVIGFLCIWASFFHALNDAEIVQH